MTVQTWMHTEIIVGDITVDVVKKDIKNLNLRVSHIMGRVRIAAPLRINNEAIRLFIVSKILLRSHITLLYK